MFACLSSTTTTLFSLVLLLASANLVHGWGADGHSLVAGIAQSLLNDNTSTFVRNHLPAEINGNMSNVSSWADNILYPDTDPDYWNWQWSKQLHYVNTQDWSCVYDRQRDCNWTTDQRCVDGSIQNYTKRLADTTLDSTQRQEALKFIIHFIGDAHQPLHAGFAGDEGGNTIHGHFFGTSVKLHALWDTNMIERRINSDFQSQPQSYLSYLIKQMKTTYAPNISDWTNCGSSDESRYLACSTLWIQEDAKLDCDVVYLDENGDKITPQTGFDLGQTYYNTRMVTVEIRLIQAGVRLAAVLNKIVESVGPETDPDETYSTIELLLGVLIIQSFLIFLLLMYSILRRKTVIIVEPSLNGEKKERMVLV